jgi:hypothetical protein
MGRQAEARAYFERGQSLFAQTACPWVRMRCSFTASRTPDPLRTWAKKLIDKKPFKQRNAENNP